MRNMLGVTMGNRLARINLGFRYNTGPCRLGRVGEKEGNN